MARRATVIFINSLTSYIRMGLGLLIGLLTTRVALRVLADDPAHAKAIFGTFAVLLSIVGFTIFLNESLQAALVRFLAVAIHRDDRVQAKRLFSTGWAMSTIVGGIVAAVIAVAAPWLIRLFNIPPGLLAEARGTLWLMAGTHFLTAALQPWQAAVMAEDRFTLLNVTGLLQQAMILGGVVALQWLPGFRLLGLAAAMLLPVVLMMGVLAAWVAAKRAWFRLSLREIGQDKCRELLGMAGWNSLAAFSCSLLDRANQVVTNLLLGPAFNAAYAVTNQFQGYVVRCTNVLPSVLLPAASQIAVHGQQEHKQQLLVRATRYTLALAVPMTIGLSVFRAELLWAWLGPGFDEAIRVFPIAMLIVLVQCAAAASSIYMNASNRLRLPALVALMDGCTNVAMGLFFILVLRLGLSGIFLGTFLTSVFSRGLFFTAYAARLVGMRPVAFWRTAFVGPFLSIIWLLPVLVLIQRADLAPALFWPLIVGIVAAYAVWVWFTLFGSFERQLFAVWLKASLRRVRIIDAQKRFSLDS